MTHEDHLALLRGGVKAGTALWADLGSGTGAFTMALAALLGGEGRILSVDRDARALAEQERSMRARFPRLVVELAAADFTRLTGISGLDGVVMANSLHFQRDAEGVLRGVKGWLLPAGRIVIVEYEVSLPNPWVPYPVPFKRLLRLAEAAALGPARLLETRPSRYHGRVYSAVMERSEAAER